MSVQTSVVGTRVRRLDALEKVTGRARYATELRVPGMLVGRVLRSDRPHARLLRVETGPAERLPGVFAVATGLDAPGLYGTSYKEQPALARERVRFVGEPVAVVAAETAEIAEQALGLIEVEYEDLPAVFDPLEALQPGAPILHPRLREYAGAPDDGREGNRSVRVVFERGDVERALAESDLVVEQTFVTASVHQSAIEPRAVLADVDASGRLTVWATTQSPFGLRAILAEALSMPVSRIRVIGTTVGGGFGSKLEPLIEHVCAILALKARRPVFMLHSREEELAYNTPRHPHHITLTTGVRRDGTLLARRAYVVQESGAYSGDTPIIAAVAAHMAGGPYRLPNARVEVVGALTNVPPFGSFRAPGGPQMVFAVESQMDTVAERLGIDPLDLRLKNVWNDGDVAINGQVLRDPGAREALERAAEAIGWRDGRRAQSADGQLRGKGLACGWWTTTGGSASAVVQLQDDGTVTVLSGAAEIGGGSITALAQFAADALTVPFEQVRVSIGDTDLAPFDVGAVGSRTTFNQGHAVTLASNDLTTQMRQVASRLLEVAAEDVELSAGQARVRGAPGRATSYQQIAQASQQEGGVLIGRGSYLAPPAAFDPAVVHGCHLPNWNSPSYFCHAAEVEVDPDSGQVRVLDYVAVHDTGLVVNPTYAEGQIQGGVAQGFGMALTEELIYEQGSLVNRDWSLYKLPTTQEAPAARTILIEHPDADGPRGAKGLGEAPVVPPPAAIANAVAAATSYRATRLPLRAEDILRAIEGQD